MRKQSVLRAMALLALKGITPAYYEQLLLRQYIGGELSIDEVLALLALHSKR